MKVWVVKIRSTRLQRIKRVDENRSVSVVVVVEAPTPQYKSEMSVFCSLRRCDLQPYQTLSAAPPPGPLPDVLL